MVGVARRRLSGLIVSTVSLRNIRSYARLDLDLRPGLVLVVGENGAGKTNLLESLHVGTQGFSPRTRTDAQLIRFGDRTARIAVRGRRATVPFEVEVTLEAGAREGAEGKGAQAAPAGQLRFVAATPVF